MVARRLTDRLAPAATVLLIYTITPAGAEITENLMHLLATGHTAHAIADEEHAPSSPEHGCSGPFHTCACHSTISFLVSSVQEMVPQPVPIARDARVEERHGPADGHLTRVFRPPRSL